MIYALIISVYFSNQFPFPGETVKVAVLFVACSSSSLVFGNGIKSKNVFVIKQACVGTVFRLGCFNCSGYQKKTIPLQAQICNLCLAKQGKI
jgi:hypothetical protein